jgi:pimeloyl-ACP methyl ester carboxylesterase
MNQEFVTSADGTTISYLTAGSGPAVLVVPGALTTAAEFSVLSRELAQNFRVHTVDRRGRGLSGPQGDNYSITKECEDVRALQEKTGAE